MGVALKKRSRMALILAAVSFLSLATLLYANSSSRLSASPSLFYSFEIVKEFPHDETAFTQGLLYGGNDTFYESTGLYGKSSVRRVHLQTGKVLDIHHMDKSYFGEGLTMSGERLLQVTWLTQTGFIYDKSTLNQLRTFTHHMKDGWGLATDGNIIFGSDGTSTLYKLDANTLKGIGETTVKYNDIEILYLNELEYINGEVWANIWMSDCIARISPKTGSVLGWILLHKLRQNLYASAHNEIDVLNGIAWDAQQKRLFVTGKLWPKLYEIKLQPLKEHYEDIVNVCQLRKAGNAY
ncbi:glutaminyl-peptide cyclotransferase isoform X2 [Nymphaea colorata]|uniref:glutaminyl-peptide cyclotransferase isoform X2 n=1 Tax=Nymphaea colorata TaxID=210225 RepID=UPI00129E3D39|nr:glutaminyl-peptide cyclotransferase isoform X2 [Nymphaea colorata]